MRSFLCDTSVLVAAAETLHPDHERSLPLIQAAEPGTAFCSLHSLAEMYSAMSRMRSPAMRRLTDVLDSIDAVIGRFSPISLDSAEYRWVIEQVARSENRGGVVYDAIILKCAEKAGVDVVYTWNLSHFRRIAWPGIAHRIQTP